MASIKGAMKVSAVEPDKEVYSRAKDVMLAYLKRARLVAKTMPFAIRQALRGNADKDDVQPWTGFGLVQLESTMQKYSETFTGLVLCLLRSACDGPTENGLNLIVKVKDPTMAEKVRRLKAQLSQLPRGPVEEADFNIVPLHDVLVHVCRPAPGEQLQTEEDTEQMLFQYVILFSLMELPGDSSGCGYAIKNVKVLSPLFSKLTYLIHAVVELEAVRANWDATFPKAAQTHLRTQGLVTWVSTSANMMNTPFCVIHHYGKVAARILRSASGVPAICKISDTECTIDGYRLSKQYLATTVHELVERAEALMALDVLRGLNTDWVGKLLAPGGTSIIEHLSETKPHYSFLNDKDNREFEHHRHDLVHHLLASDELYGQYGVCAPGDEGMTWNKKNFAAWAHRCDQLTEMMNLLLLFTCGQPARGAEMMSYLIRNTTTNLRTFFWSKETLTIVQTYFKQNSNSNAGMSRQTVKFLPPQLRRMFLVYLVVVRSAQAFFVRFLEGGPQKQVDYLDRWLVGEAKSLFSADGISKGVKQCFARSWKKSEDDGEQGQAPQAIGTKKYRHFAKFLSRRTLFTQKALENMDGSIHTSAGHTVETSMLKYARDLLGHPDVSEAEWDSGFYASKMWQQKVLNFPAPSSMLRGKRAISEKASCHHCARHRPVCGEVSGPEAGCNGSPPPIPDGGSGLIPTHGSPSMRAECCRPAKLQRGLQEHIPSTGTRGPSSLLPGVDLMDGKFAPRAKLSLVEMNYAWWKSPEQAKAVALALEGATSFIAILATGSGKSSIYYAPAKCMRNVVVVVVVPLRMLLWKHMLSCNEAGVVCWKWECNRDRPDGMGTLPPAESSGVVFVSVEDAGSHAFHSWARQQYQVSRLRTIFIDEVHLLLCGYRSQMTELYRLGQLECQLIGLTASLRPDQEMEVGRMLCRRELGVIRASTVRPNLAYSATNVSDMAGGKPNESLDDKMDRVIATRLVGWALESGIQAGLEDERMDQVIDDVGQAGPVADAGADRAMVYCFTITQAKDTKLALEKLAVELGFPLSFALLHADLSEAEFKAQLVSWEQGVTPVVVTTGVIGCGYDYERVRLVLHKGLSYSLADYHQQSGRCGRDGKLGRCEVVYAPAWNAWWVKLCTEGDKDKEKEGTAPKRMKNLEQVEQLRVADAWIQNRSECRRVRLHLEMDGQAERCDLVPKGELCNVCVGHKGETPLPPWEVTDAPHYVELDVCAIERGQWSVPRQTVGYGAGDEAYHRDVDSFKMLRSYGQKLELASAFKEICYLCSPPDRLEFESVVHPISQCPRGSGNCLRCMSSEHRLSACPVKQLAKQAKYSNCCHMCHFPMKPAHGLELHFGAQEGERVCSAGKVGDAILRLIWFCYRHEDLKVSLLKDLKTSLRGTGDSWHWPQSDADVEPWLLNDRSGSPFNNFVRVGALCVEKYGRWLFLNR